MNKRIENLISRKRNLTFIGVVVCSILFFSLQKYYSYQVQVIQNDAHVQLKAIAHLKISQISRWNYERIADAKTISNNKLFIDGVETWLKNETNNSIKVKLESTLSSIKSNYNYNNVMLCSPGEKILLGIDLKFIEHNNDLLRTIKNVIDTKKILSTDLYINKSIDKICLDYVAPIIASNGDVIAIIILSVNPSDYLYPLINEWPAPNKTSETVIARRECDSVLYLNQLKRQKNTALKLSRALTSIEMPAVQAALGYKGIFEGKNYKGIDVLAYIEPIPNTNWVMVVQVDHSEVYANLYFREKVIITFIAIIIIILLLGLILIFQHRRRNVYKELFVKEKELREYHEEYKTILYSIGDGVITTDANGKIKKMNAIAEELTGWKEAEALGKAGKEIFKVINEETREDIENPIIKVLTEGTIVGLAKHTLLISKNGNEIPIADSGAPIRNEEGEITGVILVFRNQTEERFAASLLKARLNIVEYSVSHTTQELLQNALDEICDLIASPIGFFHFVENDQVTLSLQTWSTKTKKEFCKAEGKGFHYDIDKAGVWADCIYTKKPIIHNDYASLKNKKGLPQGHAPVIRELVVPVIRSGKVVAILGVGNKQTEYTLKDIEIVSFLSDVAWESLSRKRSEDAIRVSKERLNRAEFASKSGNWELHLATKKMISSKGARLLYGIKHEDSDYEIIKKSPLPQYRPMLDEALRNLIEKNEPYNLEFKIKTADTGEIKDIHSIATYDKEMGVLFGVIQDITERKRSEDELRSSEQRFGLLFNCINDAVLVHKMNGGEAGRFTEVNEIACNRLGYSREELLEMTPLDIDSGGMEESKIRAIESLINQGHAVFEMIHVSKSGQKIPVEISSRLFQSDGIQYVLSIARDISERKQAEIKIKQMLERYNLATRAASLGVWDWDAKGNIMVWDERMYQLYGVQKEDFSGAIDAWQKGLHPEDYERSNKEFEMALSGERSFDTEFRVLWPNGTVRFIKAYAQIVRDELGEPLRAIGINYDITDQKNAERAIKESEELLRKVTDNMPAYIALVDQQTLKYKFANQKFVTSFNKNKDEIIGSHISEVIGEANTDFAMAYIDIVRQGKSASYINNFNIAEGERFINVNYVPFLDDKNNVVDILVLSQDVTEIKQAEQVLSKNAVELKALNATKDKLFSIIAHDLKSPFTGIIGFSELLYENIDRYNIEKTKHFINQINQTAKSTFILLENLLTWAKAQTGKIEFKPQGLQLKPIIQDVISVLNSAAKIKNISLNSFESDNSLVFADRNMLHTILRNLVSNAIKFTQHGGRIEIYSIVIDGKIEVTVKDNGVGMNEETQKKLFNKDSSLSTKGTAHESGTGLGLILCKDFIERQGGEIWFTSELGKGTEFKFTLPLG